MPQGWEEFAGDELRQALAETRGAAEGMLDLAWHLEVNLPGTRAAFRSGVLRESKAAIIARATALLDPGEARAAEALVLGRAGKLTPGGLRAAIARAVMQIAPEKARKRREEEAGNARVERWAEDSGNAGLAGRELPPAQVLAADQRITWWARQLNKAGLDGDMDQLRARAFLDIVLGQDSRPPGQGQSAAPAAGGQGSGPGGEADSDNKGSGPGGEADDDGQGSGSSGEADDAGDGDGQGGDGPGRPGDGGPGRPDPAGPGTPPGAGVIPAGFAGRVNLTVPLATVLDLADRPGEIPGIGPVDPWLARDLARAAAQDPRTTWCPTVTDDLGQAIGHGCARPEPKSHTAGAGKRQKPGPPGGHDPPGGTTSAPGPGFSFAAVDEHGPPGGYGTWRFATGVPGQPGLLVAVDPIATQDCDHRFQASGHDPGVKLRHLTQIRHATCTGPSCRRPAVNCDFEHNVPYEAGGRTCMCNGGPKCRHDHRIKQDPRWKVDQPTPGTIRWTTPSGRQYITEPTRYPI